jgi:hypothetical protein
LRWKHQKRRIEHVFDDGAAGENGGWLPSAVPAPSLPARLTPGRSEPSAAVVALRTTLTTLAAVDPVELPAELALADARELLATRAQLDALLLRRLGDVDARKLHQLDASPTTTSWVRAQDAAVDAWTITLARRLNRLPALDDAVQSGSLGPDAAARIASALTKLRPLVDRPDGLIDGQPGEATVTAVVLDGVADLVFQALGGLSDGDPRVSELRDALSEVSCAPTSQLARLEAAFVLLAQHLPAGYLPGALSMLVDALLPNELEKRAAKAADAAQVTLRPNADGSGWLLRAELDLETGELAHTVLTAMAATDPDNPTDTSTAEQLRASGWEFGDPIPDTLPGSDRPWDPPRSRGRRMHDALKLALRAILDSGELGLRDKVAPHVGVTLGLSTLNQDPGAKPAVAASGLALPLSLVKKWWCDASVTRYVLGLGHRVLETSHTSRTLKAHERRIKHLETGGHCQGAGCTRGPGRRLIPHHPDAWANSGTTTLDDTVLLCDHDHDALHRGQTITLKNGRRLNQHGWLP